MQRLILTGLALLTATAAIGCGGGASHAPAGPAQPYTEAQNYPQPAGAYPAAPPTDGDGADYDSEPTPSQPAPEARSSTAQDPFGLDRPQNRPGLATSWGEARHSRVSSAPFVRAASTSPFAVGKLFYNDPDGIAAMSDSHPGSQVRTRRFEVGAGHVDFGLRDGGGNFLTGFTTRGDNYIAGVAGRRYTIVVNNHSPGRIEAVVSVDGLDVIDGKPAAVAKRGYLIEPFGDLEIEGFRTSTTEVAAFRFGSVAQSYANKKHGETRNVGVIGVAAFHERGDNPNNWDHPRDTATRHDADPFPQKFAAPPDSY